MVMVRSTLDEAGFDGCAGREIVGTAYLAGMRRQFRTAPQSVENVTFCSTTQLGTAPVTYWVHFDWNGHPTPLVPISVALSLGIVDQGAVDRFMAGPRRSQEELDSQRAQLDHDTRVAADQAAEFQASASNFFGDLRKSWDEFRQDAAPILVVAVVAGAAYLASRLLEARGR